jgi:hypothetical protein
LDVASYLADLGELDAYMPWNFSDNGVHDPKFIGNGWTRANWDERSPVKALRAYRIKTGG